MSTNEQLKNDRDRHAALIGQLNTALAVAQKERDEAQAQVAEMRDLIYRMRMTTKAQAMTLMLSGYLESTSCGSGMIHVTDEIEAWEKISGFGKGDLTYGELADLVNEVAAERLQTLRSKGTK